MVAISVKLNESLAREIREQVQSPGANKVLEVAHSRGADLKPMHPALDHPSLNTFYIAIAPDDQAEELAQALQNTEGVEAAFLKPETKLPGTS